MFQCIDGGKINGKLVKNEFVFVTLVTSQKEYDEHLKSLLDNEFKSENCSFVFLIIRMEIITIHLNHLITF